MKTKLLKLKDIVTTAGTQIRAKIDTDTVDQYAEAMQDATNKFPPVVVYHDGSQFILADGFHRVMAASRNGFLDIEAEINKGTRSDALKYALGANATHGLKRTNADKRRSVELALTEWPKLSDREIARVCAVSNRFVSDMRHEAATVNRSQLEEHRIGADGKERKMPKRISKEDGGEETTAANDNKKGGTYETEVKPSTDSDESDPPAVVPHIRTSEEILAEQPDDIERNPQGIPRAFTVQQIEDSLRHIIKQVIDYIPDADLKAVKKLWLTMGAELDTQIRKERS